MKIHDGSILSFRHEIEISEDDPHLFIGESLAEVIKTLGLVIGINEDCATRWYYYTDILRVDSVSEYDADENVWTKMKT